MEKDKKKRKRQYRSSSEEEDNTCPPPPPDGDIIDKLQLIDEKVEKKTATVNTTNPTFKCILYASEQQPHLRACLLAFAESWLLFRIIFLC